MLAEFESCPGYRQVKIGREADIDGIELRVGNEVAPIAVFANAGKIEFTDLTPQIAAHMRKIAFARSWIVCADGGNGNPADARKSLEVSSAHESETQNANFHEGMVAIREKRS
jgi:hypothetical protein